MIKFLRKFVLFVAVLAFLLNAAGIPLFIHLAEHKADSHHDGDKCPICQQAVANKTKIILPTVSITFELPQITIANTDAVDCFVKNSKFITPPLRGPPSAA
jgi:hypothetical protein